jgi:biotin carboxyl carrier protein
MDAALGAVFLYGLTEDPGRMKVQEWLVEPGEEVLKGQELVTLESRTGDDVYAVSAPRDGIISVFTAEERDRVEYGDTLGYILTESE